jgi:hypothetical protein
MLDKDTAVQGIAVYAEFARSNSTTQVILTPDGYNSVGELVPMCLIRRTITTATPKKQWKFSSLAALPNLDQIQDDAVEDYGDARLNVIGVFFDQLIRGDWKMVKSPVLLEASRKDMDSICAQKTPAKLTYRIAQSRMALGFPDDLINEVVAV